MISLTLFSLKSLLVLFLIVCTYYNMPNLSMKKIQNLGTKKEKYILQVWCIVILVYRD